MPALVDDFLTNSAYGFPTRGHARVIKPEILAVVHITANLASAANQRHYANRAGSPGPSAHYYLDRDGGGVHAVDEARYAAWSNGDLKAPDTGNRGVRYLVALRSIGHNANEGCYLEIECVGEANLAGQPTDDQFATLARLIADASAETGLPINRSTVLTHADINSVDRANCAFLARLRAASMARLIAMALAAVGGTDVYEIDVTSAAPKLVDIPAGAKILNLDGSARLTAPDARLNVLSPFASTSDGGTALRAIVWTAAAPTSDLLLAVYGNAVENVRDVAGGSEKIGGLKVAKAAADAAAAL